MSAVVFWGFVTRHMSLSRTGEDITYLRSFNVAGEVNFSAFIYKHKWSNGLDMRLPEHSFVIER